MTHRPNGRDPRAPGLAAFASLVADETR
ncbi:transcriptional regulator, partial [Streptomyces sp. SID89]|nr:transcriptional regulator [Streptomyces sp. SID89]NED72038.1 transcriptional regulator [Streptomyces sp. SID9944]